LACWDLNGNGLPDVATEDRNGDGSVNINDCSVATRWARVQGSGAIIAQSGGISVIHGGLGFWFVTFPGNTVWDRAITGTLSRFVFPPLNIELGPCGGPPQGVNCTQSNNANTVLVNITNDGGNGSDQDFYIVVFG